MASFFNSTLLLLWLPGPDSHIVLDAIFFLLSALIILLIYILVYLLFKNRSDALKKRWQKIISLLIQSAIFNEEESTVAVQGKLSTLLRNKAFRNTLTRELLAARKNFSGSAGNNLRSLYLQLGLSADSLQKLNSPSWHLRAQAIQELAVMGYAGALDKIYKLANHQNEQIRMEAQTAVIQLSGFEGLQFLDFLTYPLSGWQQIKLISELGKTQEGFAVFIEKWLRSANDSVVIFSLKLAGIYHYFELYNQVVPCLLHPGLHVRLQAVQTLQEIYTSETGALLVRMYNDQEPELKLAILEVLQQIGTEAELPFLLRELRDGDDSLKLASGRAVAAVGPQGIESLEAFPQADEYPWNHIVRQIREEMAA